MDNNQEPLQTGVGGQSAVGPQPQPMVSQPVTPQPVTPQPVAPQPAAPQPVVSQPMMGEPVMSQPAMSQPVVEQLITTQPIQSSQSSDMPQAKKNNKMIFGIIIAIVAVLAVVGAIVAIMMLNQNSSAISVEKVRNYCQQNGMTIQEFGAEQSIQGQSITCANTSSQSGGISAISYTVSDEPLDDEALDAFKMVTSLYTSLIDTNNYKKMYLEGANGISYLIIKDNSVLIVAGSDNNSVKSLLAEFGYPDDMWAVEEETSGADSTTDAQSTQRDLVRRNDMSRLDTSLVQYQTNNMGKLPVGPSFWKGVSKIECTTTDVACNFVRNYMNSGVSSGVRDNVFVDPDGTPYSLYITENWAENEGITTGFGNTSSTLVAVGDGFTIGGSSPFAEHVIYVIPGGTCNDTQDGIIKINNARNYGIMYMLESGDVYCIDDQ